jgi:type I restriction enzyme R subunit
VVPYNLFEIQTKVTKERAQLELGEKVYHREKLTRKEFYNQLDEDLEYSAKQLDGEVENVKQIRFIARTYVNNTTERLQL